MRCWWMVYSSLPFAFYGSEDEVGRFPWRRGKISPNHPMAREAASELREFMASGIPLPEREREALGIHALMGR